MHAHSEKKMITSCQILGFEGILLQLSVGLLSFFSLVLKRWLEFPKRPWKIWILDSSKQAISLIIIHFINLTISLVLSNNLSNDACLWYFITNLMDNTLGVLIIYLLLKFVQKYILEGRCPSLISGNYYEVMVEGVSRSPDFSIQQGEESKISRKMPSVNLTIAVKVSILAWIIQFLIWMMIASMCKAVLFVVELRYNKPLNEISMLLFRWVQPFPILQLTITIIVIPITLNGMALWIQDNFLKKDPQQIFYDNLEQIQSSV